MKLRLVVPAWAPSLTSFRSAIVMAPSAGESARPKIAWLPCSTGRLNDDDLGPLRRDRVLLQVEVEVLRRRADGRVEGRAHPRHGSSVEAHLAGDGERHGGLEALPDSGASSIDVRRERRVAGGDRRARRRSCVGRRPRRRRLGRRVRCRRLRSVAVPSRWRRRRRRTRAAHEQAADEERGNGGDVACDLSRS